MGRKPKPSQNVQRRIAPLVKPQIARSLCSEEYERLHPDLEEYYDWDDDGHIHHPLIAAQVLYPQSFASVNREYRAKKELSDQAQLNHDWESYVFLHEKPYRLRALRYCIRHGLCGSEYWQLVGPIWMSTEFFWDDLKDWRAIWRAEKATRGHVMTEEEREAHERLGDETTVWRGTEYQESINGLSWTTDKDKAAWFARRFLDPGCSGLLATGTVRRENVYAIFQRRGENELVCRKVKILKTDPVVRGP